MVEEIAVDYYAHSRIYYTTFENHIYISDDWRALPHDSSALNIFQTLYFLNWDSCFDGETYFDELKYFSPTYVYRIIDKKLEREFIPFPDMESGSLFDAIGKTISAFTPIKDKVGVMLSGGVDSSQIALLAKTNALDFKYLTAHIDDLDMYDNAQDERGATIFADMLGLNLDVVDVIIEKFLTGWNENLEKYVAFSYKDGRLWQGIAKEAAAKGYKYVINGQNADALYNYSWTGSSPFDVLMRSLTTDDLLEEVFEKKHYSNQLKEIWKTYTSADIDEVLFLSWLIVKGNGYRNYCGMVVDKAANKKIKELYDVQLKQRMAAFIDLFRSGNLLSVRHLLLQCKMVGYVDGEDTRCISGACLSNGIKSLQLYTTPLVYDALLKLKITDEDIEIAKRNSIGECNKAEAFLKAQEAKHTINPKGTYNASEVWQIVYNILDKEYNFDEKTEKALRLFDKYQLFDEQELSILINEDVGIKVRVAWMGLIYDIWEKSAEKTDFRGNK